MEAFIKFIGKGLYNIVVFICELAFWKKADDLTTEDKSNKK